MLQSINGTVKNWIILPLFTLLILSFVAWGIADAFRNRTKQSVVITAGSVKYDAQQVQNEVQHSLDYLRRMTGAAITVEMADQLGIVDRSIENLVSTALLRQESQRLGIVISDNVILNSVRSVPEFKKADGSFDADKFRATLAQVGASEQSFLANQRVALAQGKLQDLVHYGIRPSPLLQKALSAADQEKRTFETYQIKFTAQPQSPAPSDEDLQKYIADNKGRFSTQETRTISVVRLTPAIIGKSISVGDDAVKAYYDAHADEFAAPETRSFEQVVAPTEDAAKKAAANFPGDQKPTQLADVRASDLPNELQQPAFALKEGATSAPIQSPLGWHVLRVTKITAPKTVTFDDAKKTIRTNLQTDAANDRLYDESAHLDDMLAAGSSLEDIAKEIDTTVEKFPGLTLAGKAPDALAKQTTLLQEAFKLGEGAQSNVISMGEDGYAIVRVDSVAAAALKPFANIKAEALAAWQREQQQKMAQEKALKLLSDLRKGMTFDDAAKTYGAEATHEAAITKENATAIKYLPDSAADDLFKMKQGEATQFPGTDAIIVVRFDQSTLPVSVADAKPNALTERTLEEGMQSEMLVAYLNGLRQRYTVTVDKPAIRALFAKPDNPEE